MKNLVYLTLCLLFVACTPTRQEQLSKQIIGEWCNPYTYGDSGELKGFNFKEGGVCEAINVPSLELQTWAIDENGYLTIKGIDIAEDGTRSPYESRERIELLNTDTLSLVAKEENPKLMFTYLNTKIIKERVTVQQQEPATETVTDTTVVEQ